MAAWWELRLRAATILNPPTGRRNERALLQSSPGLALSPLPSDRRPGQVLKCPRS